MISSELSRAIVFSIPLLATLVCLVLAIVDLSRPVHRVRRKMRRCTIITYSIIVLVWVGLILHEVSPGLFLSGMWLFIPLMMAYQMFLYRNVHTMTYTGYGKDFSFWHLAGPASMLIVMIIVDYTWDKDSLYEVLYNYEESTVVYVIMCIILTYNFLYHILNLVRIVRFKRSAVGNQTNDVHLHSLDYIFWMLILDMIVLPVPVCGLFLGWHWLLAGGFIWILAVMPAAFIYLTICRNLFSDNYLIVEPDAPKDAPLAPESTLRVRRDKLEQYLEIKKPWLNPEYRITDMAEDLFSNRAYVSAFVNREYGMNFNRLVNGYRLREVERLKSEAAQKKQYVSSLQLILNAGFNSYRSYLRAKSEPGGNDSTGNNKNSYVANNGNGGESRNRYN